MDEDALDADARLPGVAEGGGRDLGDRGQPVAVRLDDDGRVAAEFEGDFFLGGLRFELPSDLGAAGEADHLDPRVHEKRGDVLVIERDNIDLARRDAGGIEDLREQEAGERGLQRGFEDHAVAGREARSDFVGDEVEREVEWRDAEDHAHRKAFDQAEMPGPRRAGIHRDPVAFVGERKRGGEAEGQARAFGLGLGKRDRLPRLGDDRRNEIRPALRDEARDVFQDDSPRVGGHFPRGLERRVGGCDRLLNLRGVGKADVRQTGAVPGIDDGMAAFRIHMAAVDEERFRLHGRSIRSARLRASRQKSEAPRG